MLQLPLAEMFSKLVMHSVLQYLYSGPFMQTDQQAGSLDLLGPHSWFQVLEIVTTHCTAVTKANHVIKRRLQLHAPAYLLCFSGLTNLWSRVVSHSWDE